MTHCLPPQSHFAELAVILSGAKNLALSVSAQCEILCRLRFLRMTAPRGFSAAYELPGQRTRLLVNSHRQHDAELCVAAQHARVSLSRFFERIGFNHGAHAGEFGEVQRILRIRRYSRHPPLDASTSNNELYWRDLNGIKCHPHHHQLAVRPQTVDQLRHGFRTWGCRQNDLCAAQFLQFARSVGRFAIDVHVRSEFLCECGISGSATDRRDFISKLVGELNSQVAQTANTLHRHQVARQRPTVPQRVVGGNSGAQQWCSFDVAQTVRYRRQGLDGSHHELLVPTVIADARDFHIAAIAEVSAPAGVARSVMAAVPAHANTLALLPGGNTRTEFINNARDLVPGNSGILNAWPQAILGEHVTVADPTGLHLDAYVTCAGRGNFALDDLKIGSPLGNLCHLHGCCCKSCRCHKSSFKL
ncbi:hypothetical protein SBA2_410053 [Acidobacteriia bacterium SbA2]|nr:hypothetical protein SBA2_410053 [Acidobacteriia bacterium SbA2]